MTLEITFEKAHLNLTGPEANTIVSKHTIQRSYVMFRVNDQVEYTVVRHGTEPVWDDIQFRCAQQDIFIFEVKVATAEHPQPSDRIFGRGSWDFREFLRRNRPEQYDDQVPFSEEILLKSPDTYGPVGRLFIRLKYIMGKLHIGGLIRFGQKIDLTNHQLDISKIRLIDIPVSPIIYDANGSMMRSGVMQMGQQRQVLNPNLATSNVFRQSVVLENQQPGSGHFGQAGMGTNQLPMMANRPPQGNSPPRLPSPVEQFGSRPQTNSSSSQVNVDVIPPSAIRNQTSSGVVTPQPGFGSIVGPNANQYQSATGLNFQTGHIGENEVMGISRGSNQPTTQSNMRSTTQFPNQQPLNQSMTKMVQPVVVQSFTYPPNAARSTSPIMGMSTPVRDEQFTLVKGCADKSNLFSWMDGANQRMEVAPGRVFNDFCKSRCRTAFPPYPNA